MVNGKGKDITDDDLVVVAEGIGVSASKTKEMIQAVEDALSEYPNLIKEFK